MWCIVHLVIFIMIFHWGVLHSAFCICPWDACVYNARSNASWDNEHVHSIVMIRFCFVYQLHFVDNQCLFWFWWSFMCISRLQHTTNAFGAVECRQHHFKGSTVSVSTPGAPFTEIKPWKCTIGAVWDVITYPPRSMLIYLNHHCNLGM